MTSKINDSFPNEQPGELRKALAAELKNLFPQEKVKPQLQKGWNEHFYLTIAGDLICNVPDNLKVDLVEGRLSVSIVEEEKKEGFAGFIEQATKIFSDTPKAPGIKEVFEDALSKSSWRKFFTDYDVPKVWPKQPRV